MYLEGLYVLLAWSVADFSSCQGNNSIKHKLILSGLNCNIVFCSISLTKMFTNKAQGFSTSSSSFCLSVVCIWGISKGKRNKSVKKIPQFVLALQRRPFISSATHKKTCIFLSFNVSIFHFLYLKHKSHNSIYAIGYVQSICISFMH